MYRKKIFLTSEAWWPTKVTPRKGSERIHRRLGQVSGGFGAGGEPKFPNNAAVDWSTRIGKILEKTATQESE